MVCSLQQITHKLYIGYRPGIGIGKVVAGKIRVRIRPSSGGSAMGWDRFQWHLQDSHLKPDPPLGRVRYMPAKLLM